MRIYYQHDITSIQERYKKTLRNGDFMAFCTGGVTSCCTLFMVPMGAPILLILLIGLLPITTIAMIAQTAFVGAETHSLTTRGFVDELRMAGWSNSFIVSW